MTIHTIDSERMKQLVKRCFPPESRAILLEQAEYTGCYAVQFDHDEVDMFLALAVNMAHYFTSSVVVSLYDTRCYHADCEIIEDCLTRRSSFHETVMVDTPGQEGIITVAAASILSNRIQNIDYFIHLLGHPPRTLDLPDLPEEDGAE